ncbi:MAG: transcriptional regulator [Streptosporangiales bacterium]|nr:transcriptional regulator [Streptosporangiales bacterium]
MQRTEGPTGAELRQLYDAGASIRTIGRALGGWSYGTVHGRLARAGTQFRPRGGRAAVPEVREDFPGDAQ